MRQLSEFAIGGYLTSEPYPIFVRAIGNGPPLVVVHGGPGLDHTYLLDWLMLLTAYRTLIFYDQAGCGRDHTPAQDVSGTSTIHQLIALITGLDLKGHWGILAHSWGTFPALSILNKLQGNLPGEIVISNP